MNALAHRRRKLLALFQTMVAMGQIDAGTPQDSRHGRHAFDTFRRNHAFDTFGAEQTCEWELETIISDPFQLHVWDGDLYVVRGRNATGYVNKRNGGAWDIFINGTCQFTDRTPVIWSGPGTNDRLYMHGLQDPYGRCWNITTGTPVQEVAAVTGDKAFRFNGSYFFWARARRNSGSWTASAAPSYSGGIHGDFWFDSKAVSNGTLYWTGTDTLTNATVGGANFPAGFQMGSDGTYMYGVNGGGYVYRLTSLAVGWDNTWSALPVVDLEAVLAYHTYYYNGILYVAGVQELANFDNMVIYERPDSTGVWTLTHSVLVTELSGNCYGWFKEFGGYMFLCMYGRIWRKLIV